MTTPDEKNEQDDELLQALAGGIQEAEAQTDELVNPLGEPVHDRFAALIAPSELGLPDAPADPAATADPAGMVMLGDDQAVAAVATAPAPDQADAAAVAVPAPAGGMDASLANDLYGTRTTTRSAPRYTPPQPAGFAALFQTRGISKATARHRARLFRIIMIPALLAVGLTLVICCFVTLAMLIFGSSANAVGEHRPYIQQFGRYIIIAGLPLAAFLLMGAWLFFLELQKLKPIADEGNEDK